MKPDPTTPSPTTPSPDVPVDRKAILHGVSLGLAVIAPALVARVVLDAILGNKSNDESWILFVVILIGYFFAGRRAVGRTRRDPFRHGTLTGLATLAIWLPPWIAFSEIFGDGIGGDLIPGIFGHAVFALTFAMIGGLAGMRRVGSPQTGGEHPGEKTLPRKTRPRKEP